VAVYAIQCLALLLAAGACHFIYPPKPVLSKLVPSAVEGVEGFICQVLFAAMYCAGPLPIRPRNAHAHATPTCHPERHRRVAASSAAWGCKSPFSRRRLGDVLPNTLRSLSSAQPKSSDAPVAGTSRNTNACSPPILLRMFRAQPPIRIIRHPHP